MRMVHSLLLCGLILLISCQKFQDKLETISPEEALFSSEKLKNVDSFLEQHGSSAFLAIYDGKIFYSWGDINEKYPIHSIRKPLLSALYGIYIEKGIIDLNQTLRELEIDDIEPSLTEEEKKAKVIDLLQSKSGIYHAAGAEAEEMISKRPERGSYKPGTYFYYNNWDFNVLGTIFEKKTGKKIFEVFDEDIAKPINMQHYKGIFEEVYTINSAEDIPLTDGFYHYEMEKSRHPAYHFQMSAYDLAIFGLLYMKNGCWNGNQIIPAEWIEKSTKPYSISDPEIGLGYGYLWNVLPEDDVLGRCFLHTGNGVHLLAIFPDIKLVIVHRVDTTKPYNFSTQKLFYLWDIFFKAKN